MPLLHPRASDWIGVGWGLSIRSFQSSQVIFKGRKGWGPAFCIAVLAAGNFHGKHLFHLLWTLQIEFLERTLFSKCAFIIWAYLQIVSQNLIKKGTSCYGKFSVRRCWCVILGHGRKNLLITQKWQSNKIICHDTSGNKSLSERVASSPTTAASSGLAHEDLRHTHQGLPTICGMWEVSEESYEVRGSPF